MAIERFQSSPPSPLSTPWQRMPLQVQDLRIYQEWSLWKAVLFYKLLSSCKTSQTSEWSDALRDSSVVDQVSLLLFYGGFSGRLTKPTFFTTPRRSDAPESTISQTASKFQRKKSQRVSDFAMALQSDRWTHELQLFLAGAKLARQQSARWQITLEYWKRCRDSAWPMLTTNVGSATNSTIKVSSTYLHSYHPQYLSLHCRSKQAKQQSTSSRELLE